jgi:hypothetical protein
VWSQRPTFSLAYEARPADNVQHRYARRCGITYDSDNIYVAFRAHDAESQKIRARSTRIATRQMPMISSDTFNDQRRGFEFFINPYGKAGLTSDASPRP